ncbi:hypothetical protein B7C51_24775 (plasmid) [Paenibacillus larvae subsp. pulvifaciens]|uniref:Uncharacterized protein n=1 Tax=Paenibacillus larvae subsp. pulvifaciens TaxID=1477 RepID=A0A1V0V018_9BACL|nr:hypothetical protein [Paenibacillus larvae]ARF70691.1 hypothetical protein B7C51_24775 [Paenibacillus larvae subsp. pulvifaciens]
MPRQVICRTCLKKSPINEMKCDETISDSGNKYRKYYHHGECWEKSVQEKEFLLKERNELDSLNDTIKRIHEIDSVPHVFFRDYLQPLRNGNFKQNRKKALYKAGFNYNLIEETYKYCEKVIRAAKKKKFEGTLNELKYCFAIVVDKIYIVKKRNEKSRKNKELTDKKANLSQSMEDIDFNNRSIEYKKKKVTNDISEFLD